MLPADNPARGLIYKGLAVGTENDCPGTYAIAGTDLCTHGPDPAPPWIDPSVRAVPPSVGLAETPGVVCDGDGTTGYRFQVLYVVPTGGTDVYDQYLNYFRTTIAGVDTILNESAAETGGVRHLRLVTDADCNVVVTKVSVTNATVNNFQTLINELDALGYREFERKYLIFMEANALCGIASVYQSSDQTAVSNPNNRGRATRASIPGAGTTT